MYFQCLWTSEILFELIFLHIFCSGDFQIPQKMKLQPSTYGKRGAHHSAKCGKLTHLVQTLSFYEVKIILNKNALRSIHCVVPQIYTIRSHVAPGA